MIKIVLYKDDLKLYFNGEFFTECITIARKYGLKFTEDNGYKYYTGKPVYFYNAIPELESMEKVEYVPDEKMIKDFCKPKLNIKYFRRNVNDDLLKYKPVKGKAPFENYQYDDLNRVIGANRKIITWDTGLGKSWLGVNTINQIQPYTTIEKVVIICPNHLKINWSQEIVKFSNNIVEDKDIYIVNTKNRLPFQSDCKYIIMSFKNLVMISDDAYRQTKNYKLKKRVSEKKDKLLQKELDYLVENRKTLIKGTPSYSLCLKDIKSIEKKIKDNNYLMSYNKSYLDIPFDKYKSMIIIDESHEIKNNSRQTKIAHYIKDYFDYRYILTATFMPNSETDIYYQTTFIDDNLIPLEYDAFLQEYFILGNKYSDYAIVSCRQDKFQELLDYLKPHIIMRKAEDCLDIPETTYKNIYMELSDKQLKLYRSIISYELNVVKDIHGELESNQIFNKMPFILQSLENPIMLLNKVDKDKNQDLYNLLLNWKFEDHSALEYLDGIIDEKISKEKIIIFSQHPDTIEKLKLYYSKHKPFIIHGQVKGKNKEDDKNNTINEFKTNEKRHLLIANPEIIKTGLTINECKNIIYFDISYKYETYYQSSKRIVRIGQTKTTTIYKLFFINTIQMLIEKALERKGNLRDFFTKKDYLSKDELKNLFEGKEI